MTDQISEFMTVGLVQFSPDKSAADAHGTPTVLLNLARMKSYIVNAASTGVQFLVFPELGVSGYDIDTAALDSAIEHSASVLQVRRCPMYTLGHSSIPCNCFADSPLARPCLTLPATGVSA